MRWSLKLTLLIVFEILRFTDDLEVTSIASITGRTAAIVVLVLSGRGGDDPAAHCQPERRQGDGHFPVRER